jgi:hypothetical protein
MLWHWQKKIHLLYAEVNAVKAVQLEGYGLQGRGFGV